MLTLNVSFEVMTATMALGTVGVAYENRLTLVSFSRSHTQTVNSLNSGMDRYTA